MGLGTSMATRRNKDGMASADSGDPSLVNSGLASSAGASLLVLTQVFTKLATFSLNQLLVQYVTPTVLGTASYWEFVAQTILFFSREAERLAVQRADSDVAANSADNAPQTSNHAEWVAKAAAGADSAAKDAASASGASLKSSLQKVVNFGHLPLLVGVPMTAFMLVWSLRTQNASILILVSILVILELMAEPMYALNQFQLGFSKRSRIESLAVICRCLTTFCGVVFAARTKNDVHAATAYVAGQLVYAAVVYTMYRNSSHKMRPISNSGLVWKRYFAPQLLSVWRGLFIQMIFKHLLTEGDRLLISWLCSAEEQGVYALVTNYGSILARVLFQPVEESLRLVLSKELSTPGSKIQTQKAAKNMGYILLMYFHLSVVMVLGGYSNGAYVLHFALGRSKALIWKETNVFQIFPQYILYLPFLAFNGVIEAFFSSTASELQIQKFSCFMLGLTAFILLLLYWLIQVQNWGLLGLMVANSANMALRIIYCTNFMQKYLKTRGIKTSIWQSILRIRIGIALAVALGFSQYITTEKLQIYGFPKLVLGCFTCLTYLAIIAASERTLIEGPIRHAIKFKRS